MQFSETNLTQIQPNYLTQNCIKSKSENTNHDDQLSQSFFFNLLPKTYFYKWLFQFIICLYLVNTFTMEQYEFITTKIVYSEQNMNVVQDIEYN